MTEEKLVPELRFQEFEGEWKKKTLGDLGKFYNGLRGKNKDYFVNGNKKYIQYLNIFQNTIIDNNFKDYNYVLVEDNENQNQVKYGDLLFTQSSETYEEIGMTSVYLGTIEIYLNSFSFGFRFDNPNDISFKYIAYLFESEFMRRKIIKEGQGSTRINLSSNRLKNINLPLPIKKEQEKIGSFFSKIDKKIELQEQLIENLEEQKKGLMQKIFNQEVRFKDENGKDYPEWKEEKIKNMGTLLTSSVNKKIEKDEKIVNLYNYMDVYNKKHIDKINLNALEKTSATDHQIKTNNLLKGDILITPSSETPEDIGHSIVIWEDLPNTLYSYHLLRFRPKIKMDLTFSNYWFNNERVRKKIITRSQGATRYTISIKNLEDIKVNYPVIGEQIKIGNILSLADKKIDLAKEELENYKEFKKGLMQRMFI